MFSCLLFSVCTDCRVYICDFHREQAWERWTKMTKHGVGKDKDTVLASLRKIAHASSEAEFSKAVELLKKSPEWIRNKQLQQWITNTWLPVHRVCIKH